jgi:hypothetical protein
MKLILLSKIIAILAVVSYLFACVGEHTDDEDYLRIFDILKVIFLIFIVFMFYYS